MPAATNIAPPPPRRFGGSVVRWFAGSAVRRFAGSEVRWFAVSEARSRQLVEQEPGPRGSPQAPQGPGALISRVLP